MMIDLLLTGFLQGLLLACVAYAITVTFRLLQLKDITAEGAYPMGGAITARLLLAGYCPAGALLGGALAGGVLGVVTSIIHVRLKMDALLAGIIVSTMAYSINLRIMERPNLALFNLPTLFAQGGTVYMIVIVGLFIAGGALAVYAFLQTAYGLRLRAVGLHASFAQRQGIPVASYICLGMGAAGVFAGLGGGLVVQVQRYMDIGIGAGIVVHALAALMLGEVLVGNATTKQVLLAPLVGSVVYQQLQGLVLLAGLAPSDTKLFTGLFVLGVVALQRKK